MFNPDNSKELKMEDTPSYENSNKTKKKTCYLGHMSHITWIAMALGQDQWPQLSAQKLP